jgi:hypothetical protein
MNRSQQVQSEATERRTPLRFLRAVVAIAAVFAVAAPSARANDINNEYRLTLFPSVKLNDDITGFSYLGYVNNPDKDFQNGYIGAGARYRVKPWLYVWAGLISTYVDNETRSDRLEVRPFIGPKIFAPNPWKWNIYNFTRYEWREFRDIDTGAWTETQRLRSRFGVEAPLTSVENAWKPETWYALTDVEPFYNFDSHDVDLFRWRTGVGHIFNERVRAELIYYMQYTRGVTDESLEHSEDIFRLNIRIAFGVGKPQEEEGVDE